MKVPILQTVYLVAGVLATAETRTATIYIQPVHPSNIEPVPLAEVQYYLAPQPASEVIFYEYPDVPEDTELLRIGAYDPSSSTWASSTSVISVKNFAKGYAPNMLLSVDSQGNLVGASCQGVRIDAGHTRDFGPQAVLLVAGKGKQPDLNKPVVLSREGKKVVEQEKTFLQKYWWAIGIALFLLMSGGGDQK